MHEEKQCSSGKSGRRANFSVGLKKIVPGKKMVFMCGTDVLLSYTEISQPKILHYS